MLLVVIGIVIAVALCIWALISPRSVYWGLQAWAHRDPEANEPSDIAYALTRVGSAIALILLGTAAVQLWSTNAETQRADDRAAVCEDELLPALREVWNGQATTESQMRSFAQVHDLSVDVQVSPVPSWAEEVGQKDTVSYTFADEAGGVLYATTSDYATSPNPRCLTD